jgi:hypothetical protein
VYLLQLTNRSNSFPTESIIYRTWSQYSALAII